MRNQKLTLDSSVTDIPRIADATKQRLLSLGINTVRDLITYYPRDVEDRSETITMDSLMPDVMQTFEGRVITKPTTVKAGRYKVTKCKVSDDTGIVDLVWFNQPYIVKNLHVNEDYIFSGKLKSNFGRLECSNPTFEGINSKHVLTGTLVPKYRLTNGISLRQLKGYIKSALNEVKDELDDFIPEEILDDYDLCDYRYAVENIHFPLSQDDYNVAKKRLKFEEFYLIQIALSLLKNKTTLKKDGIKFKDVDMKEIMSVFPFEFTNAQKRVVSEIEKDMTSNRIMNRLVCGDVGSGKTACAYCAMMIAKQSGYQAALMAPTEILAEQHYKFFTEYAEKCGFTVRLLTGSLKKSEKDKIYEELRNGEIDFAIGTHALIQKDVEFKNLGLVITDEQHRFGVEQRSIISNKGNNPDVLVMTATPIPRTLGLILYGDLDISVIDELPKGRQTIDTLVVNSSYYERMYSFVKKEIASGRQAFVICPMVEDSDKESMADVNAVTSYAEMLKTNYLKDETVEVIHGKMKAKEKTELMNKFNSGEIDVLVSTTVVEVGINNPNASIMIVENAERFGLSQLHQLRGRVGRGEYKSYCILISESNSKISKDRLATMKKTSDGFKIAEEDLKIRGPGDFFGTKQHGLPEFKIANLYEDTDLLKMAQNAANDTLKSDRLLEDNIYSKLKERALDVLIDSVL